VNCDDIKTPGRLFFLKKAKNQAGFLEVPKTILVLKELHISEHKNVTPA
jgi:hypothetical protein